MEPDKPHSSTLRKGRYSASGLTYFITSNVEGKQALITPSAREIIIEAIKWARDNERIWLLGYVIMDNHFHFMPMLREGHDLSKLMGSLKRHTSREINKLTQNRGQLWQEGYHDHAIRDETDFWNHFHYMHNNPVRRNWVGRAEDYLWSTAHPSRKGDIDWNAIGPLGWSGEVG
jgi:REP element-mobilizing transposase RayT